MARLVRAAEEPVQEDDIDGSRRRLELLESLATSEAHLARRRRGGALAGILATLAVTLAIGWLVRERSAPFNLRASASSVRFRSLSSGPLTLGATVEAISIQGARLVAAPEAMRTDSLDSVALVSAKGSIRIAPLRTGPGMWVQVERMQTSAAYQLTIEPQGAPVEVNMTLAGTIKVNDAERSFPVPEQVSFESAGGEPLVVTFETSQRTLTVPVRIDAIRFEVVDNRGDSQVAISSIRDALLLFSDYPDKKVSMSRGQHLSIGLSDALLQAIEAPIDGELDITASGIATAVQNGRGRIRRDEMPSLLDRYRESREAAALVGVVSAFATLMFSAWQWLRDT